MYYLNQTEEELLQGGIPDFFRDWYPNMRADNDLGLYSALDREFPAPKSFEPVLISAAAGAQNAYMAIGAGDLVRGLALSLWHGRRAETENIIRGLSCVNATLAEVVQTCYLAAKRGQGRRIEAAALKV